MLPFLYPAWITKDHFWYRFMYCITVTWQHTCTGWTRYWYGRERRGPWDYCFESFLQLNNKYENIWTLLLKVFLYVIAKDYSVRPKTCVAYSGTFLNTGSTNKVDLWNRSKWDSSKQICLIVTNQNDYVFANSDT